MVKKRTLSAGEMDKVQEAIRRLGDKAYALREKAVVELVARGRPVLPLLRAALKNSDLEVSRRAQRCLQRIEEEPANRMPAAAFRLLALRKPVAAVETLLNYLPFAEEDTLADAELTLSTLAMREGKPDAALLEALGNSQPVVRGAAAEALAKAGGPQALPAVRKLLNDADVSVRLLVLLRRICPVSKAGKSTMS